MGSKWSSSNAPGTENTLSHSILKLGEIHFPIIGPQYESEKGVKFPEQKGLNGMQMFQFECPRH